MLTGDIGVRDRMDLTSISYNGVVILRRANLSFNNTASVNVNVTSNGTMSANVTFDVNVSSFSTVIKQEAFTATANQTAFTLSNALSPANVNYLIVNRNGVTLEPTTHYTLSGQILTLLANSGVNDIIDVREFIGANIQNPSVVLNEQFTSTANQSVFTLNNVLQPANVNYIIVFRNGLEQTPTVDYTVSGQTLTFTSNSTLNDLIEVREFIGINVANGGIAAGQNTQIQFNLNGSLAGSSNLTYQDGTGGLVVNNNVYITLNNSAYSAAPNLISGVRIINNSNAAQSLLEFFANTSQMVGRIRSDYQGNMAYLANGGAHVFFTGGDSGAANSAFPLYIAATGSKVGIGGINAPNGTLHIIGGVNPNVAVMNLDTTGSVTASNSLITVARDQTTYSLLGRTQAGPGIQVRYDSGTSNRYFALGSYDNNGVFSEYMRTQEGLRSFKGSVGNTNIFSDGSIQVCGDLGAVSSAYSLFKGIELGYYNAQSTVLVQSYDRGNSAYIPMTLRASQVQLQNAAGVALSTTGSSPNLFQDSTNGNVLRQTSSIRYKVDVENLWANVSSKIYEMRPVWYRSNTDTTVDPSWISWYGLIAEEVALLDPRLVSWNKDENDKPIPEGVAYDRLTVLLIAEMKKMATTINDLQQRILQIEGTSNLK